jgi:hypothetical protein
MVAKGLFITALGPLIGENKRRGHVFSNVILNAKACHTTDDKVNKGQRLSFLVVY